MEKKDINEDVEKHEHYKENTKQEYEIKQKKLKVMNYYYNNNKKINIGIASLFGVIFLIFIVYILLPQNTIQGVSNKHLVQNIKKDEKSLKSTFVITNIPTNYTQEQTIAYTKEILDLITPQSEQNSFKIAFDFLLNNCSTVLNENDQILYNSLYKRLNRSEIIDILNQENLSKKTSLSLCKIESVKLDKLSRLEEQKNIIEYKIKTNEESKEFRKEAYGDVYNSDSGKFNYNNKSHDTIIEERNSKKSEQNINSKYNNINKSIEKTNKEIEKEKKKNINNAEKSINQ